MLHKQRDLQPPYLAKHKDPKPLLSQVLDFLKSNPYPILFLPYYPKSLHFPKSSEYLDANNLPTKYIVRRYKCFQWDPNVQHKNRY